MKAIKIPVLAIMVLGATSFAAAKDLAVVANKLTIVGSITQAELVKICKGQGERWPDGKPVVFITRSPALPEMKLLLDKVYGMTKEDVMTLIASANRGRSHPSIVIVDTDEELVKRVESTPGAVGLVDVYSINGGVNVLKVGGKLPLEPGYALHGN